MDGFILKCYEEYKTFMDIKEELLPSINPIEIGISKRDNGKCIYAYINEDEIGNNPMNLYYSSDLFNCHKTFQKAKLFHEFTHILDGFELIKKYSKFLLPIMNTYSEYHASQIELASNIGFKNIHCFHKFNIDKTFVYDQDRKIKITSDYISPASDALAIIGVSSNSYYDLSEYDYYLNYKTFETKTMYYLGKKNFCLKYSIKNVPDLTKKWYGNFYPFIYEVEQTIINCDFEKMSDVRNRLWRQYYVTFPFKNLGKLLIQLSK